MDAETDRWISLHAFHHGGTDALIAQAVGETIRRLDDDDLLAGFFFLRYWEGGPHVRLRLRPTGRAAHVERLATTTLESHLAAHPAQGTWDPDRYAAAAERFAAAEGIPDHDRRLRPHGRVENIPYRPEHDVFGGVQTTWAAERHFGDSSRIALALLQSDIERGQRLGFATAALILALTAWEPDPVLLTRTLTQSRAQWDTTSGRVESYERQRPALMRQLSRCRRIAAESSDTARDPLGAWWRSIHTLRREITACQAAGRFHPTPATSSLHPPGLPQPRSDVLVLLLRCVHLLCNRLGLTGTEETHLRRLAAAVLCEPDDPKECG